MTFDVTTFVFEIINFLVLVWLLHRFFYRPVLAALDRRRAGIEQRLTESRTLREEAAALEQRYQERLAGWEHERQEARARLQTELLAERDKQMARLREELELERDRQLTLERQRDQERALRAEGAALDLALAFSKRLLERIAGPELEARLVAMATDDLAALPEERRRAIAQTLHDHPAPVHVATAFPLNGGAREKLTAALQALAGPGVNVEFAEKPELLAGLRIDAGNWVLSANLGEQLRFFQEASHETRLGTPTG